MAVPLSPPKLLWTIKTRTPREPRRCAGVARVLVSMDQLVHPAHPTDAPSVWDVLRSDKHLKLVCFVPELIILLKEATNIRDKGKYRLQQRWGRSHVFNHNSKILGLGLAALRSLQTGNATLETVNCSLPAAVPRGCNSNPHFVLVYFTERPVSITVYIINSGKKSK